MVASQATPTGDLACIPGMCPNWESNQQPFGSQAHTQSTEVHQPGLQSMFLMGKNPQIDFLKIWIYDNTYIYVKKKLKAKER